MNEIFITFLVLLLKLKYNRIVFLKINLSGSLVVKKVKGRERERERESEREKEREKEREREFNLGILINSALYTVSMCYLPP